MMIQADVQARIEREVPHLRRWGEWFRENRIEPQCVDVFTDLSQTARTKAWVFTSEEGNGYRVYYDPAEDTFGLTVLLMGGGECLMGLCDSSLDETIEHM